MKKPICNGYTMIWVEVPDAPQRLPRRGTPAPGAAVLARFRNVKSALIRNWQGQRLAGALAGAAAALALVITPLVVHRG